MSIRKQIALHPASKDHVNQSLGDAVHHLMYCAKMCLSCADACMAEKMDMAQCIRLCLDCSDICEVTARLGLGGPATTSRFCANCSNYAPACASSARRNANGMTMSIAGYARRFAANAPRTAAMRRPPYHNRHAELVSASIAETVERVEEWTLKPVQGDGSNQAALRPRSFLALASFFSTMSRFSLDRWSMKSTPSR